MRVGDHDDIQVASAQMLHETLGLRAPANAMGIGRLYLWDIEIQRLAPEIQTIPVEPTLLLDKKGCQRFLTGRDIESALPTPLAGNNRAPEMIVEFEIEEGAVHVQQNRI